MRALRVLAVRSDNTVLCEDNQACHTIAVSGQNPTMRHLERTHRVSVKWAHERFNTGEFDIEKVDTDVQASDIFTKAFLEVKKWEQVCALANTLDPSLCEGGVRK